MRNTFRGGERLEFLIRDNGKIFNKVKRPAIVFDKYTGTMHKIGEYEEMELYFKIAVEAYKRQGFYGQAEDITFMELPKEQEEIDKAFQNTGYLLKLYNSLGKIKED